MNRRNAIKQFFVVAGGIMIASACDFTPTATSIQLNHIKLFRAEEDLLAELVEAILPQSDSPGAGELKLHLFVMKMVDDCTSPADQQLFLDGLKLAESVKGQPIDKVQRYLLNLSEKQDVFFKILKGRTIQGYKNSEYIMKNKLVYELVPGRYNGSVKIEA